MLPFRPIITNHITFHVLRIELVPVLYVLRVMEDEQEAELRNPFPSPPSHYTNYTTHNLQLFSLLKERTEGQNTSELTQTEMLSDQTDVPEWPLTSLEKPRVDWIREEGYYDVFGDRWFVRPCPIFCCK